LITVKGHEAYFCVGNAVLIASGDILCTPIRVELVHSVTLIAQPRSKYPLVKRSMLQVGKFETKSNGTFGLIWFTEFGEKFWEACQSIDDNAKLRLRKSGFDEMDWSVSFRFIEFKARLTAKKYKGFFGKPNNSYIEMKVGCLNPNDLRMFLQALVGKFETPPWIMNNWKKTEKATGFTKEYIISSWSEAMGKEITDEETEKKRWGSSLFSSKDKSTESNEDSEFEIFEDDDGNEVKMTIHGALEIEGNEYAIMAYDGGTEFEIMKINRQKDGNISYSGIDDPELYEELSEAATEHLQSSGAV